MSKKNALSIFTGTIAALTLGITFSATISVAEATQTNAGVKPNPVALQKAQAARKLLTASSPRNLKSKEFAVNPYAAYPASCLADGLYSYQASGLPYPADPNRQTVAVTLYDYNSSTGNYDPESVNVSIWRVPCSGGTSATLLEIDRSSDNEANGDEFPIYPNFFLTQNGAGYNDCTGGSTACTYPRQPADPNTVYSDTAVGGALIYSSLTVFDIYNPSVSFTNGQIDYNQAFTLNIDTTFTDSNNNEIVYTVNVPGYNSANFGGYPSALMPMEISGYMSTNWSSQTEDAEGIVLQVYDNGDQATRTLAFAWFTYDDLHLPFWLYGQASLPIGATSVTAQTVYFKGGTFAGSGGGGTLTNWGTVTFKFPDCGHMAIAYNGDASADNGPKGSGATQFVRVASVNGLACQ